MFYQVLNHPTSRNHYEITTLFLFGGGFERCLFHSVFIIAMGDIFISNDDNDDDLFFSLPSFGGMSLKTTNII